MKSEYLVILGGKTKREKEKINGIKGLKFAFFLYIKS